MPSRSVPMGKVPESRDPQAEVKPESVQSSQPEAQVPPVETEPKEPEVSIDESDLEAIEEQGKIPYSRFKEKNEEAKALQAKLDETQRLHQEEVNRLVAEREALKTLPKETEDPSILDLDQPDKEVIDLRKQVKKQQAAIDKLVGRSEEQDLQTQLASLKKVYPDLDDLAVLGWKKAKPSASLTELAELSHSRTNERLKTRMSKIIEDKKAKAKTQSPLQELSFKLKEGKKPKNTGEARELIRRFFR